ncbi:hypothetical protein [Patiriisocius marinus]|uniref:Uncharacterized protein n=1 Tax=Patiriisocius marinus TaxID=1397112 RepID=A0A5J4IYM2_9FLAO|nr:hypothetical protein [Patiriisocius marinus]GER59562.1 hypothetical protein ULMA_16700 [Patiriisocius marinus]
MKAIITFATTCAVLCTVIVKGQTNPPQPPQPPVVSSHSDATSSSTSSSYSVTTTSDDDSNRGGNISISISDTDRSYSMSAKYPDSRISAVHDVIRKELGEGERVKNKERYQWILNKGDNEVYEVDLRGNRLSIDLDKDIAGNDLTKKFSNMGKLIRNAISGRDVDTQRQAQHLQREADRLQRDADRMRRESERMQREADRLKRDQTQLQEQVNVDAERYERDALKLAEEGMRIAEQASRLNRNAADNGGVSDVVEDMLQLSSTKMSIPFENVNKWTWPNAQNTLIQALLVNKTITSDSEVVFSRDRQGIFVNGIKMDKSNYSNYDRILLNTGIPIACDFTFYKKGNHIVIVDNMARIEPVLNDLQEQGFITNLNEKAEIEINGATAVINGKQLSNNQVSEINVLLRKRNIIPSPGKTIKISGVGNYTLGYTADKVHLGTWIAND